MGKRKSTNTAQKSSNSRSTGTDDPNGALVWVDPAHIRFQHARIRPYFSGCGRSVHETLDALREGKVQISDIPPIQVLVGPSRDSDGYDDSFWYFSLNNRRLWVFKRLREEGLLASTNHRIAVRVRTPKSNAERRRYTLENCALEAKLMREGAPAKQEGRPITTSTTETETTAATATESTREAKQIRNRKTNRSIDCAKQHHDAHGDDSDKDLVAQVTKHLEKKIEFAMDQSDDASMNIDEDDASSSEQEGINGSNRSNPFSLLS